MVVAPLPEPGEACHQPAVCVRAHGHGGHRDAVGGDACGEGVEVFLALGEAIGEHDQVLYLRLLLAHDVVRLLEGAKEIGTAADLQIAELLCNGPARPHLGQGHHPVPTAVEGQHAHAVKGFQQIDG